MIYQAQELIEIRRKTRRRRKQTSETCVHLGSDVEATSVSVGPMPYGVDGMWLDGPRGDSGGLVFEPGGLIIGNHAFPKGLFAHAPSSLLFDVDPTWTT